MKPEAIKQVAVWTRSAPAQSALRVTLNAGAQTPGNTIRFDGYNARVQGVHAERGCRWDGESVRWDAAGKPVFTLDVAHMTPAFRYSGDDGHVRFLLDDDSFTISLPSLEAHGPIWFAEKGIFITETSDATTVRRSSISFGRWISMRCGGSLRPSGGARTSAGPRSGLPCPSSMHCTARI